MKSRFPHLITTAVVVLIGLTFAFQLGLLMYAFYALFGLLWLSRWLAR